MSEETVRIICYITVFVLYTLATGYMLKKKTKPLEKLIDLYDTALRQSHEHSDIMTYMSFTVLLDSVVKNEDYEMADKIKKCMLEIEARVPDIKQKANQSLNRIK